jgi:hypothetical protein
MFVVHEILPIKRKLKKIMQCPSIKSPPFDMIMFFFLERKYNYAFIVQK